MVAPFAGGSHEGQGNWNDGQSRYDSNNAPHAQTTSGDARLPFGGARQLYNNTPPSDPLAHNQPYRDSSERDRPRQNPQAMDRHMGDRDFSSVPPIPAAGGDRQKSSPANGERRRPSGSRICGKCGEPLAGQFVRALDNTFHLDCFTCHVCTIFTRVKACLD